MLDYAMHIFFLELGGWVSEGNDFALQSSLYVSVSRFFVLVLGNLVGDRIISHFEEGW